MCKTIFALPTKTSKPPKISTVVTDRLAVRDSQQDRLQHLSSVSERTMFAFECMYVCIGWVYGCMCVSMYVGMYACKYACKHVCMYVCM
jgi:hypothetical protein